ncbi:MAG: hypothetical protein ACTSUE_25900 [Promethearchaeota archaeon]
MPRDAACKPAISIALAMKPLLEGFHGIYLVTSMITRRPESGTKKTGCIPPAKSLRARADAAGGDRYGYMHWHESKVRIQGFCSAVLFKWA